MSKKKPTDNPAERSAGPSLYERMVEGDNRAARAEARGILADPAASEESKQAAREILRRTGFDRAALTAAIAGLVVVLTLAALLLLRK